MPNEHNSLSTGYCNLLYLVVGLQSNPSMFNGIDVPRKLGLWELFESYSLGQLAVVVGHVARLIIPWAIARTFVANVSCFMHQQVWNVN